MYAIWDVTLKKMSHGGGGFGHNPNRKEVAIGLRPPKGVLVPQILEEFGTPPVRLFTLKDCMRLNFLECTAAVFFVCKLNS